jgi:hypothetical protein
MEGDISELGSERFKESFISKVSYKFLCDPLISLSLMSSLSSSPKSSQHHNEDPWLATARIFVGYGTDVSSSFILVNRNSQALLLQARKSIMGNFISTPTHYKEEVSKSLQEKHKIKNKTRFVTETKRVRKLMDL